MALFATTSEIVSVSSSSTDEAVIESAISSLVPTNDEMYIPGGEAFADTVYVRFATG